MKAKRSIKIISILFIGLIYTIGPNCKNEHLHSIILTTTETIAISSTRVKSGGEISSSGGSEVVARGVCFSTNHTPTTSNNKTIDGTGEGPYISSMTDLQANTVYYIRAYAINSSGTFYGTELSVRTLETVSDIERNIYDIVIIGSMFWFVENLKTTTFNDGTKISLYSESPSISGWCWYNNDENIYRPTYGVLYNGYAVKTGKLCPVGWHVSTWEEWKKLIDTLGGPSLAGSKLKETGITHWNSPNTDATNESGFTAIPAGYLRQSYGTFEELGISGNWWAGQDFANSFGRLLRFDGGTVHIWAWTDIPIQLGQPYNPALFGFSVRCVRN